MHKFRLSFFVVLCCITLVNMPDVAYSQCAMCSLNAENSTIEGNTQGRGLNDGILFLLAMPFLIAGAVGFLWYKKFKHSDKNNTLHIIKQAEE